MKAYVGIADSDGLRSFVPDGNVPDGFEFMILKVKAAQGCDWACFWATVDDKSAKQIGEELVTGRRRDAMNLLLAVARDIIRYPAGGALCEADSSSAS